MAFCAVAFTLAWAVAISGAAASGGTCGAKPGSCAEAPGEPLGGSTMLQHLAAQSSREASHADEREGQERVALAALARVAKGHSAVRASLAQLGRAAFLADKAKVEAIEEQLLKAREELREAEEEAAEFSLPEEPDEPVLLADHEEEAAVGSGRRAADPVDLKDLLLLAAATDDNVNLTEAAMAELGWTPGVRVAFEEGIFRDHAWTFRKGGSCLATFAATNDLRDIEQVLDYEPMDFCGFSVHSGVVGELIGFMQQPSWDTFVEFLQSPDCVTVTAVGHSLGGALASLFAAAANRRCEPFNFGDRRDYGLVTHAPFAISKRPFWSRKRGTAFRGTRYGITELDGGVNGSAALPPDTKAFRVAILEFFANMSATLQDESQDFFAKQLRKANKERCDKVEKNWPRVEQKVVPLLSLLRFFAIAPQPGFEFLFYKSHALITNVTMGGYLSFAHDPVSSMTSYKGIGERNGYKHPLVDFQPLANPFKAPAVELAMVPAANAPDLPRGDLFQDQFAMLASQYALPNHQACCYSTVPGCHSKFTVAWKACVLSPFR